MRKNRQPWKHGRFSWLLISLFLYAILDSLFEDFVRLHILIDLFLTATLVSAIFSISANRAHYLISASLVLPMLIITWMSHFYENYWLTLSGGIFGSLFFVYLIGVILIYIFLQQEVSREVIMGSLVVYLLLGVFWAIVYRILLLHDPASFSLSAAINNERVPLVYFSFVTLTTLGYGDITPVSAPARTLAYWEAIIGQFYLTVLVARLVGVHISQGLAKK